MNSLKNELKAIESKIHFICGHKVMLDYDLAELYQVPTKRLKEQVRRNADRFPQDFMFSLTDQEVTNLRSQFATSSENWGGHRYKPLAFTEQGIAMLSSVLRSGRAIEVNIAIMRAFVQLRQIVSSDHAFEKRRLPAKELNRFMKNKED